MRGEAENWWSIIKHRICDDEASITWEMFKKSLLDRYFPSTMRESRAQEFKILDQGIACNDLKKTSPFMWLLWDV